MSTLVAERGDHLSGNPHRPGWSVQQRAEEARVACECLKVARAVEIPSTREDRDHAAWGLAASGDRNDDSTSAPRNGDSDRTGFEIVDDRCPIRGSCRSDSPSHLAMPDQLMRCAGACDELEAATRYSHIDEGGISGHDLERGFGKELQGPRSESGP